MWEHVLTEAQAQGSSDGKGAEGAGVELKEYVSDGGTRYAWNASSGEWEKAAAAPKGRGRKKGRQGKQGKQQEEEGSNDDAQGQKGQTGRSGEKEGRAAVELSEEERERRREARRKKRKERDGWQARTNTWPLGVRV